MPTYEYACQSCGRHVEVFQKFSEDSLTTCEFCGGPLRKVFHPAGILFKGSGFYATDSRRSATTSGDKKDEKKGEKKGEGKKDGGAKAPESSGSSGSDSAASGSSSKGDGSSGASSKADSSGSSRSTEKSA